MMNLGKNFEDLLRNRRERKILEDLCLSQTLRFYKNGRLNRVERVILRGLLQNKSLREIGEYLDEKSYTKQKFPPYKIHRIYKKTLERLKHEI